MKKINPLIISALILLSFFFTSCEAIAGIFKAGMGFGIFIVIAVLAIIITIIVKLAKNK